MDLPTYDEFRAASLEQRKELLRQVKLIRIQHRWQAHNDETLIIFYGCATCEAIENRIKSFEAELYA